MNEKGWRIPRLRIASFIGILHLFIAIVGAGIISGFALVFIYRNGEQSILREMESMAFVMANTLEEPIHAMRGTGKEAVTIDEALKEYFANRPGLQFTILAPDGTVLVPGSQYCTLEGITAESPEVHDALQSSIGRSIRTCPQGERMIFVAASIRHSSEVDGVLILAVPFNEVMAPTYRAMAMMGLVALLIVAVTVAEGWLGSIYISKPVANLSRIAEQFSRGGLHSRADLQGPVEVYHLAQTFNVMAVRLQDSLESMRMFVANASHELRTPLTTLKLQVNALQDGGCEEPEVAHHFLNQMEHEVDRLAHSVNEMLNLSQIEGGMKPEIQPVDLKELAREVVAFWETRARHSGVNLGLSFDPSLPVIKGEPFQLRRLFDNLLDNAIKNTPSGGSIDIEINCCTKMREVPNQTSISLQVRDTGKGIAPEHLPFIFERFFRIDTQPAGSATIGSGLGLAIARSIVRFHGGEIYVESEIGKGTTFTVLLPAE